MSTQDTLKIGYEALLISYAAGTLNQAEDLIVASHLAFSKQAQNFVSHCEAVGGAMVESFCEPIAMNDGALNSVLSKLDENETFHDDPHKGAACLKALQCDVPAPLKDTLKSQTIKWHTLFPGMKAYDLKLQCKESVARFMKADPGLKSPHHSHGGTEITLVLDGAFSDETGSYKRGDLIVTDEAHDHTPVACKNDGCICLVVTSEPIKLTGIASLLNPFLKP